MKTSALYRKGYETFERYAVKVACTVLKGLEAGNGLRLLNRYILAGGEFDAATAEFSINLVQDVLDNYAWIRKVEQVITDIGTQFYANKKDKNDESESRFESFLFKNEILHIKARVKASANKWES
jgi:hypothetical protein